MKFLRYVYGLLLSLPFVVSCSETGCIEEENYIEYGRKITIQATQEEREMESRTILQEDLSVFWNPGDEISLFFMRGENGGNKFTAQNTEVAKIAEFSGVINGITGGGEDLSGDAYFWAVYPYSKENVCENNSLVVTLPDVQRSVEESFADDLFLTVARSTGVKMGFKNVCGGLSFCVSQSGIKSVTFRGNNEEVLAGRVRVEFDESNTPVVTEVLNGQTEITLTAPNGGEFAVGKFYYLVALPKVLEQGFTLTFHKTDGTCGVYTRTTAVSIVRSRFGTVRNFDADLTYTEDGYIGGGESGFYIGITGFNNALYSYPIRHLSGATIDGFYNYIDNLTTANGTLLYYAVDTSVSDLQMATFPSNLYNVSVVTFTDGLDRGSLDVSDRFLTNSEYLTALNERLNEEVVSGQVIEAYSIGVKGKDVTNYTSFQNNLSKLATSTQNVFELTDMSEVNDTFMQIASLLGETKYVQKFILEISGPSHNEKCRFTFDQVTSYRSSNQYIEGVFNRKNKTLEDVVYVGMTSTSGSVVQGVKNENNFYVFTFEGLQTSDGVLIPSDNVQHWYTEEGVWQKDSEFVFDPGNAEVEKIKRSAAVMLNLDCSSSLGDDFMTLQTNAKAFLAKLLEYSIDEDEVSSVSLDKSETVLNIGGTAKLNAVVSPTTAIRDDVEWSSTNASAVSVDQSGMVTANSVGSATIIAKTIDGGYTATCSIEVVPDDHVILYTSRDGKIVTPNRLTFGANLIQNTYNDGQGLMIFDGKVTTIGQSAFRTSSNLASINIPDGVSSIGSQAFYGCNYLTSVNIPNSVTSIGTWVFKNCSRLSSVAIQADITSIPLHTFYGCSKLTDITIPEGLTEIDQYAFYGCSSLKSIDLPHSLMSIEGYAFNGCSSLSNIVIPDNVSLIGLEAFSGCNQLRSVTIGRSVSIIGASAFYGCYNLSEAFIDSAASIGDYAFANCTRLANVYCRSITPVTLGNYVFDNTTSSSYTPIGCLFYVPASDDDSVISAYKIAKGWSKYTAYMEEYTFSS